MHHFKVFFKTKQLVLMALFSIFTSLVSAQNDNFSGIVVKGSSHDFVIRVDTVHEYNKYISDSMHYFNIHAVEIYQTGAKEYQQSDPKFLQNFPLKVEQLELWRYDEIPTRFVDVNFDGYEDFEILHFPGMYWNTYQYYIYDPDKKEFKQDSYLVELTDPTFHKEKEYVHYSWHVGLTEFGHAVYQWQSDSLILIGEEIITYLDSDDDQGSCNRLKRVNGKIVEMECLEKSDDEPMYGLGPCLMHTHGEEECDLFENSVE